ncbi:hypothetical protein PR048_000412 [Dryococelus australis]|uniref:Uncharacterized protein n=1 Tax=Dryococelus australis TaxID=614101 RepID=A0ABQ9IF27_9NEOP|nr:hypothetical protein PR048_000412 [Dryococelus australis]
MVPCGERAGPYIPGRSTALPHSLPRPADPSNHVKCRPACRRARRARTLEDVFVVPATRITGRRKLEGVLTGLQAERENETEKTVRTADNLGQGSSAPFHARDSPSLKPQVAVHFKVTALAEGLEEKCRRLVAARQRPITMGSRRGLRSRVRSRSQGSPGRCRSNPGRGSRPRRANRSPGRCRTRTSSPSATPRRPRLQPAWRGTRKPAHDTRGGTLQLTDLKIGGELEYTKTKVAAVVKWLDYSPPALGEPGSIPGGVAPGFSHVGIVLDDVTGPAGFLGYLPFCPTLTFRRCSGERSDGDAGRPRVLYTARGPMSPPHQNPLLQRRRARNLGEENVDDVSNSPRIGWQAASRRTPTSRGCPARVVGKGPPEGFRAPPPRVYVELSSCGQPGVPLCPRRELEGFGAEGRCPLYLSKSESSWKSLVLAGQRWQQPVTSPSFFPMSDLQPGYTTRLSPKANLAQFVVGSPPDFHMWESCWTMSQVGGFFFSEIFRLPRPCIPGLLQTHLASPSNALKTKFFHSLTHTDNHRVVTIVSQRKSSQRSLIRVGANQIRWTQRVRNTCLSRRKVEERERARGDLRNEKLRGPHTHTHVYLTAGNES